MLAARYVNNDPNYLWEREKDYELHVKKIERILSESRKPKKNPVLELAEKLQNCKNENKKMLEGEKQLLINKNNQILLEKLVDISRGKESKLRDIKIQARSSPQLPKTLNTNLMRNEAERIAIENESMAKRIIHQKATIRNTELKKEVDKYLELRLHMQKFKDYYAEPPKKPRKKKKRKLPPLIGESEGRTSSNSNILSNTTHNNSTSLRKNSVSNPQSQRTLQPISGNKEDPVLEEKKTKDHDKKLDQEKKLESELAPKLESESKETKPAQKSVEVKKEIADKNDDNTQEDKNEDNEPKINEDDGDI